MYKVLLHYAREIIDPSVVHITRQLKLHVGLSFTGGQYYIIRYFVSSLDTTLNQGGGENEKSKEIPVN